MSEATIDELQIEIESDGADAAQALADYTHCAAISSASLPPEAGCAGAGADYREWAE